MIRNAAEQETSIKYLSEVVMEDGEMQENQKPKNLKHNPFAL